MQVLTFKSVDAAMSYIIENKLGSNMSTYEKQLTKNSVVKIGDIGLFIDETGILDDTIENIKNN